MKQNFHSLPLPSVILDQMDAIAAICQEFDVARLELIGSSATGEFDSRRSDIDFLVEFETGFDSGPWGSRKEEFKRRLSDQLGYDIDIVILKNVRNPYIVKSIESTRRLLYAA